MSDLSLPRREAPALGTPTDLGSDGTRDISTALTGLLAVMFVLYLKTKNFHGTRRDPSRNNDADYVTAKDMLAELRYDNQQRTGFLRQAHATCEDHNDVATASLIENWIDEAERRTWFLFEARRSDR